MKKTIQLICIALLSAATAQAGTLTLIADTSLTSWATTTGEAIRAHQAYAGAACDSFTVKIRPGAAPVLTQDSWSVSGNAPVDRSAVLVVDASLVGVDNKVVAGLLTDFLIVAQPLPGIPPPHSIHLIGHSRGATLLVDLAEQLPTVKFGQLTTLDSSPMTVPGNVLFADNYFQKQGLVQGSAIDGAYNRQITFTEPEVAFATLRDWYKTTIEGRFVTEGYYFVNCRHGLRPVEGFRNRRVGAPEMHWSYDQKTKRLTEGYAAGATGKYYLQASNDLITWRQSTNAMIFDGQPFETTIQESDRRFPNTFYRLRSTAASF